MTIDHNSPTLGLDALARRSDQRVVDMVKATAEGKHYWITAVLYRTQPPGQDMILDQENVCGFVNVHCGICGVEDNDDPRCHLLG